MLLTLRMRTPPTSLSVRSELKRRMRVEGGHEGFGLVEGRDTTVVGLAGKEEGVLRWCHKCHM